MQEIAAVARQQRGLVTCVQLDDLRIPQTTVSRWCRQGRLHRLHHGVYAVGHRALTRDTERLAAVLACGPGAALARRSAGVHASLLHQHQEGDAIEVTAPAVTRRRHAGIRVIRPPSLTDRDISVVDGIPCTTVARTRVDLAAVPNCPWLVERAVRQAEYLNVLDRDALARTIASIDRPRGVRALRAALCVDHKIGATAGSSLERRALRILLDAGLPFPILQQMFVIFGSDEIYVDFFWPEAGLIVEVDGPHHRRPVARAKDARRDAGLQALGLTVLRVSDIDLARDAGAVAAAVRALLATLSGER